MLKEVSIRAKYRTLFHQWLDDVKNALENTAELQECEVSRLPVIVIFWNKSFHYGSLYSA